MANNDVTMNKKQTYTHADLYTNTHPSVMTDFKSSKSPMNSECVLPSQQKSSKTSALDNTAQWKKNNRNYTFTLTQL